MSVRGTPESHLQRLSQILQSGQAPLRIEDLARCCANVGLRGHLAILAEPYLSRILEGQKTVESRFSRVRTPPFGKALSGDVLLLKEVSGPLRAVALVTRVESFGPLSAGEAERIMDCRKDALALDAAFIALKRNDRYATLLHLGVVVSVGALPVLKTDRRGWVVFVDQRERLL